jgi:hypothetical protein
VAVDTLAAILGYNTLLIYVALLDEAVNKLTTIVQPNEFYLKIRPIVLIRLTLESVKLIQI